MDIETKKTSIKINEVAAGCGSEVLTETDIILPDSYPDIARIIQIDATAAVKEKEIGNDRVILRGDAQFTVIYVPDPQISDMCAKSITASSKFTDVCEAKGVGADMQVKSGAEITDIEYSLINSRKIHVKATVSTTVKAYRQTETEFISDIESDVPIETLQKTALAFRQEADDEFTITVADKLEVPQNKSAIADILKVDACVTDSDIKLITGKAIIKGMVGVSTLYTCADTGDIDFFGSEIPFTEVLDLPSVGEEMDCDVDYKVGSVYYETDDDGDGARMIGVEISLTVTIDVTSRDSAVLLSDCYCKECNIDLVKRVCTIDHIAAFLTPQVPVRGNITLGDDAPSASKIYSVSAVPDINDVTLENGKAVISGMLDANVLYLTDDSEMPIHSYRAQIPFTHEEDAEGITDAAIECSAHLTDCSYSLADSRNINVKASLSLTLKLICGEKVDVVESIQTSECENTQRAPIVIYFVQNGDSLWSIAKKYKTTINEIAEINGIDASLPLIAGTKLLIP